MSKPTLSLPGKAPVPPPPLVGSGAASIVREQFSDVLERYPAPWVVGPYGDIWVAADVEKFDPETESGAEKIAGPNGSWWRSTVAKPRLVMENPESTAHPDIAALIVAAVNALAK